ncbi:cytochrome P450 family protein [Actinopolymorpha singaporensis]|uniref:Cytochrome P450 n=1 Tax=Actinopolymorpha singaporensis TaxID=117157 RepID=A0A1H1XV59_9ACTN|nr:cytochrome P450 [Actinopolymorpha singaporensis]SDT12656.1 Cytochrome P450 [Actinopolymorpha singaporensis]
MTKPGVVGSTRTAPTTELTAESGGPPPALDTGYFQDPEAVHAALREEGPARKVVLPHGWETWIVTRYDEARAALADPRLLKNGRVLDQYMDPEQLGDEMVFAEALRAHMLSSDPPDHTRLRKLVNKAFTSRRVEALRPRIEAITEELLDAMAARGADGEPVDLIDAFAFPLPMTVICELLGVPFEDREDFRAWSAVVLADDPTDDEVRTASYAMAAYLSQLIAAKRANPGEDLLTGLVQARDDNDRLDENELIAMAFLLLVAGHETTVNLIGNGVLALLRNPDQLDRLRADPSLVGGAVEEFLRYDGPINLATMRFTSEPVRLGDVEIPRGQFVLVSLASANHDESRFPDAGRLDVTRRGGGHLAFGHGIHYCVGAPLARLEAEVAFRRILDRFPELSLAIEPGEVRWRHSSLIRGVERLPVRLS